MEALSKGVTSTSAVGNSMILKSLEANSGIAPLSGIYAISPPTSGPDYLSNLTDRNLFYNTEGIDGVFISVSWADLEEPQDVYTPFSVGNPLYTALSYMITNNPSLKFALAITAGPAETPAYITAGPVRISATETYTIPNVEIPSVQAGDTTIYSPFPFDFGFIYCYKALLTNTLTTLATTTIGGIVPLSLLTSIKIGLYTGADSEITIQSWDSSQQA